MTPYTTTSKAPAMPPRDEGPMQCKVKAENLLAILKRQGHQKFSLTDVVTWQVGSAPASARLSHPIDQILAIEADLAHEFLVARGIESRLEPTAKITAADVHTAILAKGSAVPLEAIEAWLEGNGQQYTRSFFDASALPTVAASAAAHFLRSQPR